MLPRTVLESIGSSRPFLDVGGIRPVEAGGIEQVLSSLKDTLIDDDRLLDVASGVFDGLYGVFRKEEQANDPIQSTN